MANYWARITQSRTDRRRLLRAGAGLGVGAAALSLIGCGGSNNNNSSASSGSSAAASPSGASGSSAASGASGASGSTGSSASNGLVSKPTDTTASAKNGGVYVTNITTDPLSFDSISGTFSDVPHAARVYSRLVGYKVSKYPDPIEAAVVPDAATSWEVSPDGLHVTYKVRPNFKFDPRPPTNNRVMTAKDVKFSIDRFLQQSVQRGVLDNSKSKSAPIASVDAPDDSTVVINLAFPYAPLNMIMAAERYVTIMPTEADGGFDVKATMRGSGAWRLKDFQPSSSYTYEKNPDWYDADKVHLDGLSYVVQPDPAAGLAQFSTGNFWDYTVSQDDILQTKKDHAKLVMLAQEDYSAGGNWIRFGYQPGSAFLDERVRKAASMSLDRDLYVATFGNVDKFKAAGIEVPTRWNSSIFGGEAGFWIDPKDQKTYGDSAAFFKYDPAEAKKMLSAAGFADGVKTNWAYPVGFFKPPFEQQMEVLHGMWQDSGNFKLDIKTLDYNSDFGPHYTNGGTSGRASLPPQPPPAPR